MKYIKQLDSLRAIAVIFVIIRHWVPKNNIINILPTGAIGVDIFFVLSGYLITCILFDNRNIADLHSTSKKAVLKNFYMRRTLRIFPIYYLTVFLLLIFHEYMGTNIRSVYLYYITYTSNFYLFKIHAWNGMITHLWSLAVEEQFYLIWPLLILFLKKKHFLPLIFIFIFIGVVSQCLLAQIKLSSVLTFTCFDAFGLGALLAWYQTYRKEKLERLYAVLKILACIAAVLFVVSIFKKGLFLPQRTIISIMALWLISFITLKQHSSLLIKNPILNNAFLIFIGKISYGVYLYHNFIPKLNSLTFNKYINPLFPNLLSVQYRSQVFWIENIILLVLVSWISYFIIERKFLSLKKYFNYQ